MYIILNYALMIHRSPSIDNTMPADTDTGLYDGSLHHDRTFFYCSFFRYNG